MCLLAFCLFDVLVVFVVVVAVVVDDEAPPVGGGSMVASCPASLSCRCLFFSLLKSSAIRNVSLTNLSSLFSTRCLSVVVSAKNFKNLSLHACVCGSVDVCLRTTHLRLLQPVHGPYLSTSSLRT